MDCFERSGTVAVLNIFRGVGPQMHPKINASHEKSECRVGNILHRSRFVPHALRLLIDTDAHDDEDFRRKWCLTGQEAANRFLIVPELDWSCEVPDRKR